MHRDRQLTLLEPPHETVEQFSSETIVDTKAGMLSGVSRKRRVRSSPC